MRWLSWTLFSLFVWSPTLHAQDAATTSEAASPAAENAAPQAAEATAATPADDDKSAQQAAPADETAANTDTAATDSAATVDETKDGSADKPMDTERVIVSGVAGAVALAGLATGVTFGVMALNEYNCLADIATCNKTLDKPIEGSAYLDAKESVERNALYADMGYLVAATAATVAIVGAVELIFGSEEEVTE